MKILITTFPFGEIDAEPLDLMGAAQIPYEINPLRQKLCPDEVTCVSGDAKIVIVGTEPITADVMKACPNLQAIRRVGIGLDSVDLLAAREQNIKAKKWYLSLNDRVAEI